MKINNPSHTNDYPEERKKDMRRIFTLRGPREEKYLQLVNAFLDHTPTEVLYGASGADPSIMRAFPRSRVVHVDTDAAALEVLHEFEPDAISFCQDMKTYVPDTRDQKVDMVVIKAWHINGLHRFVRPGGFVLGVGIDRSIDEILEHQQFELLGIIMRDNENDPDSSYTLCTNDDGSLHDYIQPVENDKEILSLGDPLLLERIQKRIQLEDILSPQYMSLAKEDLGYVPRKKGHSEGKPVMYIFKRKGK